MGKHAVNDPEIGLTLEHGPFTTNYHDVGEGPPVLLIHGSGPGVTAFANWRLVMPELAKSHRVLAPDIVGFGYTWHAEGGPPDRNQWVEHMIGFLDTLGVEKVSVVGNSFGGALALWLATTCSERIDRLVLMGSVGAPFELTAGLDAVWGYEPSVEAMEELLTYFVYDRSLLPADLGEMRFRASAKGGAQERWASLFPAPRQRWIDAFAVAPEQLAALPHRVLLVHGRDDQVIPLDTSLYLLETIADATLHVYPRTGHWVQIEQAADFTGHVQRFLRG
ncbi:alpha/beta hydrolase [Nocardia sp. NPDC050799]|uniref:alpha/beta fold hydrolase n=1 Tax=Nocardia sp. NPDC050799 TaxID=3154842 RepID=UPI0033D92D16